MKKWLLISLIGVTIFAAALMVYRYRDNRFRSPIANKNNPKPLLAYTYENLRKRTYEGSQISMDKVVKDDPDFTSQVFFYTADGYKVSGLMNIPKSQGPHPVIIMIRGYVDPAAYTPGEGTQHAAEVFAQNGYVTLAPDFLGYGQSAPSLKDDVEDRLFTYITVMDLLASVYPVTSTSQLKNFGYGVKNISNVQIDTAKVGIWAHSNGGQIALSVLEISGKNYPTVLWAPVSKSFPESVLYYAPELDDQGKMLKKVIRNFLENYNPVEFSPTSYFSWIKAPIQLHQGDKDEEVPKQWSDDLYQKLKSLGVNIEYFTYPDQNHNFNNLEEWQQNMNRNLEFYKRYL